MIGYIITYNGIYKSLKLTPNKIYEYEGDHENGDIYSVFLLPDDLFYHLEYKKNKTCIFEIDILNVIRDKEYYVLTDKIKVLREIPKEEYNSLFNDFVFDDKGKIIEKKSENKIYEYNDKQNLICTKIDDKIDTLYEYDEDSKLIHFKGDTYEEWYDYNNNGDMIHMKDSIVSEEFYTYDFKNRLIHVNSLPGKIETWFTYDDNDNLILEKNSLGIEKYGQYDKNNNIINFKTNKGYEFNRQYDNDNNLIIHEDNTYKGNYKNNVI